MSAKGKRVKNGRDDWIRTSDLTHPKRARYQAALRPDRSKTTPLRRRQGYRTPKTAGITRSFEFHGHRLTSRLSLSPAFEKGQEAAEGVAQIEQHLAIQEFGGVLGAWSVLRVG
jgi:hypothetical protein